LFLSIDLIGGICMADKMLTPEEVASRLSVTPNTVRSWLREGSLRGVKLGKRVWRIKEADLHNYVCCEQTSDYINDDRDDALSEEDLKAVRQGLDDIKSGRYISLNDYKSGKRP
jgi:excisionase family DNA binding protein